MTSPPPLFLDDLAVGQTVTSASHVVEAEEIGAVARRFDPWPFHPEAAADGARVFRGLAARGWHTASTPRAASSLMPCLVDQAGPPDRKRLQVLTARLMVWKRGAAPE